jgi:hypothetical protein
VRFENREIWKEEDADVQTIAIKEEAKRIVDELPASATWEDLIYRLYVRQAIEAGLEDSANDRTFSTEEIRQEFEIDK